MKPGRSMPRGRTGACLAIAAVCAITPPSPGQVRPLSPQPGLALTTGQNCTTECHKNIVAHKVLHAQSNLECQACHVQTGPAKDHRFLLIRDKRELCIKCHALPHEGFDHPPAREGKCLECHDPHGSEHPKSLVADPRGDLCARCHTQQWSKAAFVHGPVAVGACVVCHKPHSSPHPKLLERDATSLCLTCHAEVKPASEAGLHVHAALEQGCTHCHDPHASDHKFQLHAEAPALCLSCHGDKMNQATASAKVVHGALTVAGGCTACHTPHSSRLPGLQRGSQPGTCLACHDKPIKASDGTMLSNMAAVLNQNPHHHGPIREGACTACHTPHAGDHFRLLDEEYPAGFYAPFALDSFKLCFKCHVPDLVLKPSGRGLTQFRDGDRNLHHLHVNQEKGRTCRACHEVHASSRHAHVRDAVPFGSAGWMLEINYKQTEEGGNCAPGCHKPQSYDRGALSPPPPTPTRTSLFGGVP